MICDILSKRTVPVVAVRSDFAERFDRLADEDGMIGDKFWTICLHRRGQGPQYDFRFPRCGIEGIRIEGASRKKRFARARRWKVDREGRDRASGCR